MLRIVCLFALFPTLSICQISMAQESESTHSNWAAFRGSGSSLTDVSNLPVSWDDKKNIAWTVTLPGYGQSSPVIWEDRVFATTMQGAMKETPTLLCVSLNDGTTIWQKQFSSTQEIKASDYVTRSSPTPAVDSDHCFAFFESGDLIATDHDGNVAWKRSLVDQYGPFKGNHGVGSSLAIDDQSVFVLVTHEGPSYLLAVDKKTGKNIWKTDLAEKVSWSSPTVAGEQIILSVSGSVQSFNRRSGKPVWSVGDVKGNTVASATVHENVAFIGSSERLNNFAIQFDPAGKSSETEIIWRSDEATSSFGSPLYRDGNVYYVNKQGVAYCLEASSGKTNWKRRLSGSSWASPIGADDKVYFFSKEGVTDVLSTDSDPTIVEANKLTVQDRIYGVAIAPSRLVVRTGTRLICVASENEGSETPNGDDPSLQIPDCPVAVTSFGAAVCDDYLYFYGGNQGNAHTYYSAGQNNIFRRVKLESGAKWESLGEVPRRQGLALVSYNNKLYRIGGFEAKNKKGEDQVIVSTPDFSVYDPEASSWTDLTPLPEPRSSFDAVVSGDILYVVGGWALQEDGSDSKWHGTAWQMDLSQDNLEWKPMPAPPHERRANSLAELGGKIYLIGGMGDDADTKTDVYVFDPKSKKWSPGPELPGQPMDGFGTSAFNTGGRIIVATFSGQILQLSENGKQWEKIKEIKPGRFFHRLVALNDEQFLILGGTSPKSGKQSSVMILDRIKE